MQCRVNNLEQQINQAENNGSVSNTQLSSGQNRNPLDDQDVTIIASGIPMSEPDNLLQKALDLKSALGNEVSSRVNITKIINTMKISFQSRYEKILVLRNKWKPKNNATYKNVYIRSSKSRIKRLIERNARTVLRNLPQVRSYRDDANGLIKPRSQDVRQRDESDYEPNRLIESIKLGQYN
ncbi:LOW QUALITY PROTEIN: hypothetical protein KUTeg_009281, partial [Tegillarca granosa]